MTLGPLEYIVIGFDKEKLNPAIAQSIERVVDAKIIRLVDVVAIGKTKDGTTVVAELDYKSDPAFESFQRLLTSEARLFTHEDLDRLADSLPAGTSGLAMLFEHRWAEEIKEALVANGGFLVSRVVVPPEVLEELSAELESQDLIATH